MDPQLVHDQFFHVRVVIGVVTGLALTRLLTGLARFVQHPGEPLYRLHLAWVGCLLLMVLTFWWFEFGLGHVGPWTFPVYVFEIGYAALFFFTSTLLFPDRMGEYAGYEDYFHARQRWFYGLLAAIFLVDMGDTLVKGVDHLRSFGALYPVAQIGLAAGAVMVARTRDRGYHWGFLALVLLDTWWVLHLYQRGG